METIETGRASRWGAIRGLRAFPVSFAIHAFGVALFILSQVVAGIGGGGLSQILPLVIFAFNLAFVGPVSVGLAWLAEERFAGGSAAFGILFSAWGGGSLVGALIAGSIERLPRFGTTLLTAACLLAAGLALLGLAPTLPVALAIILPMGVLVGFINVQYFAWIQRRVDEELRGRVMSLVMLASIGLAPLSLAAAGVLVDVGAATLMYLVAGGIILAAALLGFAWRVPALMDREAQS